MKTSDFSYNLPKEYIAQKPIEPRHNSRLMVVVRDPGQVYHSKFLQLSEYLKPSDLIVINRTRVIPARIFAKKPTGGKVEILLLRKKSVTVWEAWLGGKNVNSGAILRITEELECKVLDMLDGSKRLIEFNLPVDPFLPVIGEMPLPPYIHESIKNPERYQTVYADQIGSAAAPTAGLHFTLELINDLKCKGFHFAEVTLHIGLDTFAPVKEDDPHDHKIHQEWCELSPEAASSINEVHKAGGRIIAVGTTTVRTLESAAKKAHPGEIVNSFSGMTDLFILPGYQFRVVGGMITNFHLPKSTLLMLVSAFAGWDKVSHWYDIAIQNKYRFYSFGDAMLIL